MNNLVVLVGRICRNIELRTTTSGISTCNITLAIPRNYKNSEGIYETDFITCICYRHTAEMVSQYCQKGDLIGIHGMIQSRNYEKDGKKVYATEILTDKVNFLSSAKKQENASNENITRNDAVKEETSDPFEEFRKEADLSDIGLDDDNLPF